MEFILWAKRDDFIPYEATNFLIECILESRDALDWPINDREIILNQIVEIDSERFLGSDH